MAKRNGKGTSPNRKKIPFGDIQFVFNNLSKSQLAEYDKVAIEATQLIDALCDFAEEGGKIGMKFDDYTGAGYVCTVTFDTSGYTNAGLAMSARGADVKDALGILYYKYFVVASRDINAWAYSEGEDMLRG